MDLGLGLHLCPGTATDLVTVWISRIMVVRYPGVYSEPNESEQKQIKQGGSYLNLSYRNSCFRFQLEYSFFVASHFATVCYGLHVMNTPLA
jgi:hypothetical protein